MPEGPELHMASLFVNRMCAGVVFSGDVEKSEVSKNPNVPFRCDAYRITARSRGKEVCLTLTPIKGQIKAAQTAEPMDVVFRFGMSGHFSFTSVTDLPKHAHLRFYTTDCPPRVLSFVDTRRFGRWHPSGSWQPDRGPCVILEYESFRGNVLSHLSDKAFDRPICEMLLNQKFFNGIGNYLRAEILYRAKIPPFVKARSVLESLETKYKEEVTGKEKTDHAGEGSRSERSDFLRLCHTVPMEVVEMDRKGYEPQNADYSGFVTWLQCYNVEGMNSLRDRNGRTVWFKGAPGPMTPKDAKTPKTKRIKKTDYTMTEEKKEKPVRLQRRGKQVGVAKKLQQSKTSNNIQSEERTGTSKQNGRTKAQRKTRASVLKSNQDRAKRPKGLLRVGEGTNKTSGTTRKGRSAGAAESQCKSDGIRRGRVTT
ncbi:endonuclease 8-like 1 isoform X2 [Denticeps clupeoides]|uniref:Endonuclease 8-like 1 n=1 Tax=Denticeps clupeoides TaxID=299321 RepID=A0AAY4DFA5_9TELE|nr:endonuclease 8-like 1 isoform X2 [Denticeps clupeoides]